MSASYGVTTGIRFNVYQSLKESPYGDYIEQYDRLDAKCPTEKTAQVAAQYLRISYPNTKIYVNNDIIFGYIVNTVSLLTTVQEDK
jgi:hypothetical protein